MRFAWMKGSGDDEFLLYRLCMKKEKHWNGIETLQPHHMIWKIFSSREELEIACTAFDYDLIGELQTCMQFNDRGWLEVDHVCKTPDGKVISIKDVIDTQDIIG